MNRTTEICDVGSGGTTRRNNSGDGYYVKYICFPSLLLLFVSSFFVPLLAGVAASLLVLSCDRVPLSFCALCKLDGSVTCCVNS